MAVTSSARSSAELFAETPRHLRDVRETCEGGDRDGESFDDDAHDAGVPPKSPASPTRRGDRAAAAAAALTRDTPLEEGVYVSEPHFAPPRMDESQAWFHGDLRGGEDRDPASLFSRSLAVAPSPSSTRQSPPSSGGFVPSPAERRAAALALERSSSAPDENAGEEEAGARERAQPEEITAEREETTAEPTVLRDADDEEGHEQEEDEEEEDDEKEEEEEEEEAHVECDGSVARDANATRDEGVSDAAADDADDAVEDFAARDATSVDAAFLAALMAEAEADAEQDARGVLADDCDASPLPSPPRPLRSDPAERTRMPAAASSVERASRETTSPRASLDAEEGAFSDSSAPMTASPKPNRSLPSPPSQSPPRKRHDDDDDDDDDDDGFEARDAEGKGRAGARLREISFEDTLERPPVSRPPWDSRRPAFTNADTPHATNVDAVTKPKERESERRGIERRGSSPPTNASAPLATPRAVSARSAMETRRRAAERERAEAARLFKARREEAGREALRRYFAGGERGGNSSSEKAKRPDEPAARPGAPRTPLRLKRNERDAGTAAATATTRTPSPSRSEAASLLSGERRRADLSATAAAAQAAKAAVFEAARAAAAAAKPSLSDRQKSDADENDDASPSATSSRKPTDVAAAPRVATLDDASRLAEARDALAAVAAAERAADSVERLTRAAAAAASRREARPAGADGGTGSESADFFALSDGFDYDHDARAMPARRRARPPLPAVASFEPEQRSHVPRAEAEAAEAARERAQAEALAAIKARAAAARAEAAAAKAALDAEKAETAAAERARSAFSKRENRSSIEEAFPSWFGAEPPPGFATGAAGLGEVSPANRSPDDSARVRRDALLASPSPLPLARPKSSRSDWPLSPPPPPASFAPASASPPREPNQAPPRKKGEAMWIDVGAWSDAAAAGVPSGGWGDAQTRAQRRRDNGGVCEAQNATFSKGVFGSETNASAHPSTGVGLANAVRSGASGPAPSDDAFHAQQQQRSLADLAAARVEKTRARSARSRYGENGRPNRPSSFVSPSAQKNPSTVAAYKAASRCSNRKLIRNALAHVCLAGAAMREAREKCLKALDDVPLEIASTFVIAFRDDVAPHRFKALYALVADSSHLKKIYGAAGPATVAPSGVESTMKYDSGTREFKPLATSAVGPQTAAVVLAKR